MKSVASDYDATKNRIMKLRPLKLNNHNKINILTITEFISTKTWFNIFIKLNSKHSAFSSKLFKVGLDLGLTRDYTVTSGDRKSVV